MCTHLIKRGSRYYIRRRVPSDLAAIVGKVEITRALGTSERREAERLCRIESVKLDTEWSELRAASHAKRAITRASDTARTTVRKRAAEDQQRAFEEAQDYYYKHVKDEGVEEAERERFEEDVARQAAVLREAQKLAAQPADAITPPKSAKPAASRTSKAVRLLPDVIDAWAKERQPQARTVQIAERCARRFREMVGPLPVATIQRTHVIAFKDALLKDGQTAVNTDKILTMLSTLLSYAHDQGWLAANPAKGVKVGTRSNAKAARLPFDLPALKLIFGSPIYTAHARPAGGAGEASYWLPLLALYTGARLEELAQLAPGDVRETPYTDASGARRTCWTISITDIGEGQEVKTASSRRRVPVHPDLIALGFIQYA
jgi:integrase